MAEAIKCDICKKLEAGVGNRIQIYRVDRVICSECHAKIDEVIEKLKKE